MRGCTTTAQTEFIETLRAHRAEPVAEARALGRNGRQFFREHYDWPVIERKIPRDARAALEGTGAGAASIRCPAGSIGDDGNARRGADVVAALPVGPQAARRWPHQPSRPETVHTGTDPETGGTRGNTAADHQRPPAPGGRHAAPGAASDGIASPGLPVHQGPRHPRVRRRHRPRGPGHPSERCELAGYESEHFRGNRRSPSGATDAGLPGSSSTPVTPTNLLPAPFFHWLEGFPDRVPALPRFGWRSSTTTSRHRKYFVGVHRNAGRAQCFQGPARAAGLRRSLRSRARRFPSSTARISRGPGLSAPPMCWGGRGLTSLAPGPRRGPLSWRNQFDDEADQHPVLSARMVGEPRRIEDLIRIFPRVPRRCFNAPLTALLIVGVFSLLFRTLHGRPEPSGHRTCGIFSGRALSRAHRVGHAEARGVLRSGGTCFSVRERARRVFAWPLVEAFYKHIPVRPHTAANGGAGHDWTAAGRASTTTGIRATSPPLMDATSCRTPPFAGGHRGRRSGPQSRRLQAKDFGGDAAGVRRSDFSSHRARPRPGWQFDFWQSVRRGGNSSKSCASIARPAYLALPEAP